MKSHPKIVGIGAVLIDEIFQCNEPIIAGTSNPAELVRSAGGVMHNIMRHLRMLDTHPIFITITGKDPDGEWLTGKCKDAGINMEASFIADCVTGKWAALINPDGSLHSSAAYNPAELFLDTQLLEQRIDILTNADIILADTNLSASVIQWLIDMSRACKKLLIIEPVSVVKARKLCGLDLESVFMVTPNEDELAAVTGIADNPSQSIGSLLQKGVQMVWLHGGEHGSRVYSADKTDSLKAPDIVVKDSTGAGDAALAAWIAMYAHKQDRLTCLKAAHSLAGIVLQQPGAIAENISMTSLREAMQNFYPDDK